MPQSLLQAKEIAKAKGIADPQKDGKCLKCHSTAYNFTEQVANEKIKVEKEKSKGKLEEVRLASKLKLKEVKEMSKARIAEKKAAAKAKPKPKK